MIINSVIQQTITNKRENMKQKPYKYDEKYNAA